MRLNPFRGDFLFQSTLSVRRATFQSCILSMILRFQSTLSVRRATEAAEALDSYFNISIHALREESDC